MSTVKRVTDFITWRHISILKILRRENDVLMFLDDYEILILYSLFSKSYTDNTTEWIDTPDIEAQIAFTKWLNNK